MGYNLLEGSVNVLICLYDSLRLSFFALRYKRRNFLKRKRFCLNERLYALFIAASARRFYLNGERPPPSAIKTFIVQLPRRQSMNRNRKENARKKISKRVFIQCRAFFSCVFFLGTNRVFFFYCVNSIRWKKNKSKWKKRDMERVCEHRPPNEMSGQ